MDKRFYTNKDTFLDLAKQTTLADSALPFDQLLLDVRVKVYL